MGLSNGLDYTMIGYSSNADNGNMFSDKCFLTASCFQVELLSSRVWPDEKYMIGYLRVLQGYFTGS